MKGDNEILKQAAETIGQEFKGEKGEEVAAMLTRAARAGATPKEVLGLSDEMIEGIYAQGYRLYNTGVYDNAVKLFRMLTSINPSEPKFLMGLAACFHMQKEYIAAAGAYAVLAVVDPKNPTSFYHASDCYIKSNDPGSAIIALEMAIERAGDRPEFRALKDRAILTRDSLKKELEASLKQE